MAEKWITADPRFPLLIFLDKWKFADCIKGPTEIGEAGRNDEPQYKFLIKPNAEMIETYEIPESRFFEHNGHHVIEFVCPRKYISLVNPSPKFQTYVCRLAFDKNGEVMDWVTKDEFQREKAENDRLYNEVKLTKIQLFKAETDAKVSVSQQPLTPELIADTIDKSNSYYFSRLHDEIKELKAK